MHKGVKFMALGFVVLGLVLAWLAFMVSGQSAPSKTASPAAKTEASATPKMRVVVARRAMEAGQFLTADDVQLQEMAPVPADAVTDIATAIGRGLAQPLAQGDVVAARSLLSGISGMLQPGERAVAIKVDESTSVGHKVQPGDWVDVLVVFRKDNQEVSDTQARRLLERKRVLAYGLQTEPARLAPVPKEGSKDLLSSKSGDTTAEQVRASNPARTAVLAVHQDEVNALLLAERQGQVMLTLRSPLESAAEPAPHPAPAAEVAVLAGAATAAGSGLAGVAGSSVLTLERLTAHGDAKPANKPALPRAMPLQVPVRQVVAPAKAKPAMTGVPVEFIRGVRTETVHY